MTDDYNGSLGTHAEVIFEVVPTEATTDPHTIKDIILGTEIEGVEWKDSETKELGFGIKANFFIFKKKYDFILLFLRNSASHAAYRIT